MGKFPASFLLSKIMLLFAGPVNPCAQESRKIFCGAVSLAVQTPPDEGQRLTIPLTCEDLFVTADPRSPGKVNCES